MRLTALLILLFLGSISCTSKKADSGLPETWTKDFTISLYSGGGMQDAAINITFTYDSCRYVVRAGSEKNEKSFALTETMRADILKKMHDLKADQIRVAEEGLTNDKETDQLCFNRDGSEICISESATKQIHEEDRSRFADAWQYLSGLAEKN